MPPVNLPSDYPRFVDRAALFKLSERLDPNAEIIRLSGKTKKTTGRFKATPVKRMGDLLVINEASLSRQDYSVQFNGLDKKGKRIEQTVPRKELFDELERFNIPELVIESEIINHPPSKNCPVCDQHGLDGVLNCGIRKKGAGKSWFLPTISPSKYMIRLLKEIGVDYPVQDVRKHLRSVILTENLLGNSGNKVVPWKKFLPIKYGYGVVERLEDSWTIDKPWTDIFSPTWGCGPTYECKRSGGFFGAIPQGEETAESASS
jgi:hypothetical protein